VYSGINSGMKLLRLMQSSSVVV